MIKVGVLRGGPSSEHDISLITGNEILKAFEREPYKPLDIFIDKAGIWHVRGKPMKPEQALLDVDAVINALHGQYGEDGTVQRILDRIGVPYTGAGLYGAATSLNKPLTKDIMAKHGIKMARHKVLKASPDLEKEALTAFRSFSPPVVVKPAAAGSSVGVTLAKTFAEFWEGVKKAFQHSSQVMVEEYIKGKEATAGIVEGLRGQRYYATLPVEIVPPPNAQFFDREVKYDGSTLERVPGNFTKEETAELQRLARLAHEVLDQRSYSRSDFIVTPKGEVYFLELNSGAGVGLTKESLLPKALKAAGVSFEEFLDHLVADIMQKKK
jgi:D-alanine-D-alanine ligase